MTKKMAVVCSLAALGLLISMPGTVRAADLITNGGFEDTTPSGSGYIGNNGYSVAGWSANGGYNFIFAPNTADTSGACTAGLTLWGSNNGGANVITVSPDGGNFLAADGAFQTHAMTQDISGLTIGDTYAVSFYYGAAQQEGTDFNTATTEAWDVSLGSSPAQVTPIINNPVHGFTAWSSATFNYVATATTETLSFLADGTPNGKPPFSLLDGVTMNDEGPASTPEPTAFVAMFAGVIGVGVFARRRSRTKKSAA